MPTNCHRVGNIACPDDSPLLAPRASGDRLLPKAAVVVVVVVIIVATITIPHAATPREQSIQPRREEEDDDDDHGVGALRHSEVLCPPSVRLGLC